MATQFWKNYDSKSSYDGYISDDSKIRKHAKIISGILERNGKKKLQEIGLNGTPEQTQMSLENGFSLPIFRTM